MYMDKAFDTFVWENHPSDKTPLNAYDLNRQNFAIETIDNRVITLDETKATKVEVSNLFSDVAFRENTGEIIFTRKNGSKIIIDTAMEKIATGIYYDPVTEQLTLPLIDGTQYGVDLSKLITETEFLDSDTIYFTVESGKVKAEIKNGSIQEKHLRPDYLADIKIEVEKAKSSQRAAAESATQSESWAHGGTNTRPNEEMDNAKAYAKKAEEYSNDWKGSLLPQGTITFAELPMYGSTAGFMYNINEAFVTDSRFEEGAGYSYPAGTNVYYNKNSRWDCLSGALTKVLTQAEYDSLPQSEKVNGTIYYITDSDNALSSATDTIPGVVIVDSALSTTSKNPVQNKIITEQLNSVSSDVVSAENRQKAYTDTKIADLINGAPSTLDTLGELADAMENNQSVIEALNSAIGTKVDKISGKGLSTNDYTTAEKNKLSGISSNANNYSLPLASSSVRGGVKTGYSQNGKNYPVQLSDEKMYVNVPWTDTQQLTGVKGNAESSYRTGNVNLTPANIGAFPSSGGTVSGALTVTGDTTLQGNVRIKKASSAYGSVINIGDGDYIRISEETDDILTVKAKQININSSNANAVYINSQLALRYKKLTQAEYNALDSSKTSDNVLYFITD